MFTIIMVHVYITAQYLQQHFYQSPLMNSFSEGTSVIPGGQTGFQKGYSTINNICTHHAIISNQLNQSRKKVV